MANGTTSTARTLDSAVVVITGAGGGIGRATVLEFARRGAAVIVADLDADAAKRTATEVEAAGGQATPVVVDVADEAQVIAMVAAAVDTYGGLDVLVNNAGATAPAFIAADTNVVDIDMAVWDRTMEVNLRSMVLTTKYTIPHMLERGGGAIVNIASVAGIAGNVRIPAYSVSKAGVIALTRCIAASHGRDGIRCNAVAPGLIHTDSATKSASGAVQRAQLLARDGAPIDIASTVAFLASPEASFITAQVVVVDGGTTSHLPTDALDRPVDA